MSLGHAHDTPKNNGVKALQEKKMIGVLMRFELSTQDQISRSQQLHVIAWRRSGDGGDSAHPFMYISNSSSSNTAGNAFILALFRHKRVSIKRIFK